MERITLYDKNPDLRLVERIVAVIRDGGIVIYPTDSVYAIGCDALNARAVERIYKYRAQEATRSPLSIICRDISQVCEYARFNDDQFKLMRRNLPGPFTFILEAGHKLPKIFKARKTLGIRIPDSGILHALLEELGTPLLTASLKYEKGGAEEREYMTDPDLIAEAFDRQADILIDGGYGLDQPSTVVNLADGDVEIVRQGVGELE
jgi:tRNA threonylcarbamoyl adenosine modification protein (Sua5/YciO/YrdC/YwlC family)